MSSVAETTRSGARDRVEVEHGIYRIIAGQVGKAFRAVAYVGMKKVQESAEDTRDAAVASLKQALDERVANYRDMRSGGVPCDDEYEEVLTALCDQSPRRLLTLLAAHNRRPRTCATLGELARLLDLAEATVAADYVKLGRKLGALLNFAPASDERDGSLEPILTFATVERGASEDRPILRLRPQVARAIAVIESRPREIPRAGNA